MKTTTNPFTQSIRNEYATFVTADSFTAANPGLTPTNTKLIITSGSEGSIVKSIMVSSSDTVARSLAFYLSLDGGVTDYLLTTVPIPANAGFTTVNNVDIFLGGTFTGQTLDQTGRPILPLQAGAQIYAGLIGSAVTASKNLYVVATLEDF